MKRFSFLILLNLAIMSTNKTLACNVAEKWLLENYKKTEVMVPMRDGASLYTAIYHPVDSSERHPIIMQRTPYPLRPYGKGYAKALRDYMGVFIRNGYIIVFQNVRGTFLSEGEYENIRPLKTAPDGIDETTDTYDTVEWLLNNTLCNGAVGVKGTSYPGFYATMAAVDAHPAVKAVSPQAPVADWYMGDDVHHNGAFFLADIYRFGSSFFRHRKRPTIRSNKPLVSVDKDIYSFFLEKGSMAEIMRPYGDSLRFWNEIKAHPHYDDFWQARNPIRHLKKVKPAVMVVAGTFDAEDCYGAFETYRGIKKNSPETDLYMVIGPWAHGSWKDLKYKGLAGLSFGEGSAGYFMENIEYPFFAYYLEGKGSKPSYSSLFLPSGESLGSGLPLWREASSWPPAYVEQARLYLHADGRLNEESPVKNNASVSYISDPLNPVPYYHEESEERIRDYMAADQSFLDKRKDVLKFWGPIMDKEVFLAGPVRVSLKVSLNSTDADLIVKLIDVRPDGYKMLIRWDVMPARYRNGFEKPEAMEPGKVETIEFTMPDVAHILGRGHRLLVHIQSSSFPLVAFNPQNFIDNQYYAEKKDYRKAKIEIHCSKGQPSYIELPIESRESYICP